jgi:hypothetical protein
MPPVVLLLFGVGLYMLFWFDPPGVPNPPGVGEWKAPISLRRLLHRNSGPVLIAALLPQLVALFMVATAILWLANLSGQPLANAIIYVGLVVLIAASIGYAWLALLDRHPR